MTELILNTWMIFSPVDDLLSVVQHETSKEDQAAVEGERVDSGTHSSSLKSGNKVFNLN